MLVRDLGLALEMMLQDVTTGDDDALDDASDSEDTGGADTQETEQAKDETEDAAALPASDTAEEAPQTKQSDEEDEEGGSMKSHSEEDTSHADVLTSAITSKLEAMGLMDEQMLEERRTFEAGSAAGSSAAGVAKGGDVISVQCSVEDGEDLVPFLTRFLASKGYAPGCVSHAAFNAIKELFPHRAHLQLYQVHAVTGGTDAQAEVTVRLAEDGKTVNGQSADTDTMVASVKAYINALNKLLVKREKTVPSALSA